MSANIPLYDFKLHLSSTLDSLAVSVPAKRISRDLIQLVLYMH